MYMYSVLPTCLTNKEKRIINTFHSLLSLVSMIRSVRKLTKAEHTNKMSSNSLKGDRGTVTLRILKTFSRRITLCVRWNVQLDTQWKQ